ncbi:hypothetical protein [Arthrobacter sp. OAP107]|uniref:hypothetical protein n=1 Tax=Arthrobacter sp. OAP107 TaxID=3156445 RepID=UPI003398D5FE
MTLSDVAALAKVQRPVVSMWRKRSSGGQLPFPAAAGHIKGVELFDAGDVTAWLEATGRGNNPEARNDVAAFARMTASASAEAQSGRQIFDGLTSLLALKVITGEELSRSTTDELLDAADEADPDDLFLYAELEALGTDLHGLASFADRLADSAFSAPAAFEKLLSGRFREGLREQSDTALTDTALDLVASAAMELKSTLDGAPPFVDATPGGSDVMLRIVLQFGESSPLTLLTGDHDGGPSRLARRRLTVHGADSEHVEIDAQGAFSVNGAAVHVAQYPSPGDPGLGTTEILEAIENTVLQMDDSQRAVVIAPARLLCDPLSGDSGRLRSDLLRSGRIRAVVRLQAGLLPAKPREPQALWVLGPSYAEVPIGERWTMVADLSTTPLTPDVRQDLISDIVASMGTRATIRAHSFRFARLVQTRVLLAGKGSLVEVPPVKRRPTSAGGAEAALRIEELIRLLSQEQSGPTALPAIQPSAHDNRPGTASVQELIAAGNLRYVNGNRLDDSSFNPREGSRILGGQELRDPHSAEPRFISLLDFAAACPTGRLTEPGDVVFCTSPRPAARVDHEGGNVVVFPARILRIDDGDPGGLVPDVVAADINSLPAVDKAWRSWRLRRTPDAQRQPLVQVLAGLQHEQHQARQRLERLEELATLFTDGVAGGSLTLTHPSPNAAPIEGTE